MMRPRLCVVAFLCIVAVLVAVALCSSDSDGYGYDSATKTFTYEEQLFDYDDPSTRPWNSIASEVEAVSFVGNCRQIGKNAFFGFSSLKSVELPGTVIHIGDGAFSGCTSLESLVFSAKKIDNLAPSSSAFKDAGSFAPNGLSVVFGDSVAIIPANLFRSCGDIRIESISFGSNVTSIGDYAFSGCSKLTGLKIPSTVTRIGNGAFSGMERATELEYHCRDLPTMAGKSAFEGLGKTSGGTRLIIGDEVLSIPDGLFAGDDVRLRDVTFGRILETIGAYAFAGSGASIESLPTFLVRIGDHAFSGTSIKSVKLTDSMMLGQWIFEDCASLTEVDIRGLNDIPVGTFSGCASLVSVLYDFSLKSIGSYAFRLTALTSFVFPSGIATVGDGAFASSSVRHVSFTSAPSSIGDGAFDQCTSLEYAEIQGAGRFGSGLFSECTGLIATVMNCNVHVVDLPTILGSRTSCIVYMKNGGNGSSGDLVIRGMDDDGGAPKIVYSFGKGASGSCVLFASAVLSPECIVHSPDVVFDGWYGNDGKVSDVSALTANSELTARWTSTALNMDDDDKRDVAAVGWIAGALLIASLTMLIYVAFMRMSRY